MFSALRQHSTLYILLKSDPPKLVIGKVEAVSEPQTKAMTAFPGAFGQNYQRIVNIVATDPEGNRYEFPEMKADLSTENKVCNGIEAVVSESREAMLSEVEGLDNNSQSILNSVPYHQGVRKACAGMRAQLNPQLAKEQERDKEMLQLRTDMDGLKGSLEDIKVMLDRALNTNNHNQP